jgi:lipopolysaccharide export system permease protein
MFGKLDLYIIKKFLGTYAFSILLIISVAVVFDISEKIDDFIEKEAPLNAIIFDYYLNFIPYFANLFSSLFIFISVIFFTSKMAYNTEIIAILSSGISFRRFLRPYVISATVLALFSFFLNNYIIPPANKVRLEFEEQYIRNQIRNRSKNIHKQILPGQYFYLQSYTVSSQTGYKFTLEQFEEGRLVSKLNADRLAWDSTKGKWSTNHYYIRNIHEDGDEIIKGKGLDTTLNILPEDFARRDNVVEAMTFTELNEFIRKQKMQGSESIIALDVHWHERFAFPFSAFILTLIGVSLSSRKRRGGIGIQIGIGIALSFSYILLMQVSTNITIGNGYSPFWGVWMPNIIYGFIAYFLYRIAPK